MFACRYIVEYVKRLLCACTYIGMMTNDHVDYVSNVDNVDNADTGDNDKAILWHC